MTAKTEANIGGYPVGRFLEDLDGLASRSLINCHARGLDSILFDDTSQARVRLFYARADHDMWTNMPDESDGFQPNMSVAFHPHHCGVRLIPVFGNICNLRMVDTKLGGEKYTLDEYLYQSPITKGAGSFSKTGMTRVFSVLCTELSKGDSLSLPPRYIHTVYVPKGKSAAWLVVEGYEDDNYQNVCYSAADLTKFSFDGMYQPMPRAVLEDRLKKLGVGVSG